MHTKPAQPRYLSTTQVANRLGCNRSTITRRVARGELPYVTQTPGNGNYLFDPDVIDKLAAAEAG